jgi:PIN domain nuclease of toxin-antitoxin system
MRVLLDTHTFLWFVLNDPKLSAPARAVVEDPAKNVLVSPATYWEVAIKVSLKKLDLFAPYADFMDRGIAGNGFEILPVEPRHCGRLVALPFHHKDPFDRLLIAQALAEGVAVVGADAAFDAYGVQRLW